MALALPYEYFALFEYQRPYPSRDCLFSLFLLQLSQSNPANSEGSYFAQNMRIRNILATSVLFDYPKECPLTKFFF